MSKHYEGLYLLILLIIPVLQNAMSYIENAMYTF